MLCQTIHVWITYIQPTVTYILHCYARPCLEHITSNWWWRMSSLSHSSQWRMSSLSHSSTLHLYFERQTLSASQTFVWRYYSILVHNLLGFGQIVFSQDSCIKALGLGLSLYPIICWPFLHCWGYVLAFLLIFLDTSTTCILAKKIKE